jgi:hypothetical protein
MSLKQDRDTTTKGLPSSLKRALFAIFVVLFVASDVWRTYKSVTTGDDPFRWFGIFAFVEHPGIFIPLSFGLLAGGLLLGWRQRLKGGKFGVKPFLIFVAVVALAIFGWKVLNDI